jgi:magnesium-transporting ATPase (P-type)
VEKFWSVWFIWLIWFVLFIWLVSFSQQPNRPNKPNEQVWLGVIFSMLSAFLGRVGNKRRIELLHVATPTFRACHFGRFMFLQRQDHQRFLSAVQTVVVVHGHG